MESLHTSKYPELSYNLRHEPRTRLRIFWLSVAVLLIAAVITIRHADSLSVWFDEIWSIFHTSGSLQQIFRDPDVTWPFGYYLALHVWSQVATNNDFVLHSLGVFLGLLATAFLIRAGRKLLPASTLAGPLTGFAFATSGYATYFVLELRGYGLMLLTEAAFLCAYLSWRSRPTLKRGTFLLITQVAMMYTQFILFVVIGLAGAHTILSAVRRRERIHVVRWIAISALTGLFFLPLLPQFVRGFDLRANIGNAPLPSYFLYNFDSFYQAYSVHWDVCFAVILIGVCIGLAAAQRRKQLNWQTIGWLALWGVGIPLAAYFTKERTATFTTRYLTFTMPAAFLLIGIGLAALPRILKLRSVGMAALVILAFAPWQPYEHRPRLSDAPPVQAFMRAMSTLYRPGDWLVIDPGCHCEDALTWQYYQSLYLPQVAFQRALDGAHAGRRVWYLVRQGSEDPAVQNSVQNGRLIRQFWGPWYFIATLYEAPPLVTPVHFGDALAFRGADIDRRTAIESGDKISITLWWSTDRPLPADYSISVRLLDPNGQMVAQVDGPPAINGKSIQLSGFVPGKLYLDQRQIQVPYGLSEGDYTIKLIVYQWWDSVRLLPESGATPDKALILDTMHLFSFAVWNK